MRLQTFAIVVLVGDILLVVSMFYTGIVIVTLQRVGVILVELLLGWRLPRYEATPDRHTIPYGVAIMVGTLFSFFFFPA